MKIVARSPTVLIIRDSAVTIRALGGLFAALGAFAIWLGLTQEPDGRMAVTPMVIGSLIVVVGALMVGLPKRKTFAFSKAERVFVIAKERFGHVERQTIPLRDIVDVSLEESTSSDSGSTYRVAITLADQRRIPWTSYYTSGVASKRAVVQLVREFLELDPAPGLGSGAVTMTDERDARRSRVGLIAMGAFCSIFLGVGLTMAAKSNGDCPCFSPSARLC